MNIYNVGIKLLGIYFIAIGASTLPSFLMLFGVDDFSYMYLSMIIQPGAMLFLGLFIFFKSEKIVSLSIGNINEESLVPLNFCNATKLLGIYFVANSIAGVISRLFIVFYYERPENEELFKDALLYQNLILLAIGFTLLVKGNQVVNYIKGTT